MNKNITVSENRYGVIDFLRGIAMIAVFTNHIAAEYQLFAHHFFSVPLFIICAGITSAISINPDSFSYKDYLIKRVKRILIPFLIATTVYHVFYNRCFILKEWLWDVILCRQSISMGEMYFVFFFFQLVLIAPLLVKLYKKACFSKILSTIILLASLGLSLLSNKYGVFSSFKLASRNLLGGTFFFLFSFGIFSWFHLKPLLNKWFVSVPALLLSIAAVFFMFKYGWQYKWGSNPPNVRLILFSVCVFIIFLIIYIYAVKLKVFRYIFIPFELIGKNSLCIFMYHILVFYGFIMPVINKYGFFTGNRYVRNILIYLLCLYVPIVGKMLVDYILSKIKNAVSP